MLKYPYYMQKTNYAAVVKEIEPLSRQLSIALEPLGLQPWRIIENCTMGVTAKSGHKSTVSVGKGGKFRVAVSNLMSQPGQIQLTLIQPLDHDTVFAEYYDKFGSSWHHIEFIEDEDVCKMVENDFQQAGAEKVFEIALPDGRKCVMFDLDGVRFSIAPPFQYLSIDEMGGIL